MLSKNEKQEISHFLSFAANLCLTFSFFLHLLFKCIFIFFVFRIYQSEFVNIDPCHSGHSRNVEKFINWLPQKELKKEKFISCQGLDIN